MRQFANVQKLTLLAERETDRRYEDEALANLRDGSCTAGQVRVGSGQPVPSRYSNWGSALRHLPLSRAVAKRRRWSSYLPC